MSWARAVGGLCALAALAAGGNGCGQDRLIGRSCDEDGCEATGIGLNPPDACGQQLRLPDVQIKPGDEVRRCRLFTLDELLTPPGDDHAYITRVKVVLSPQGHDLDLRIAPEVDECRKPGSDTIVRPCPDGPVDCGDIGMRAIAWIPLMTTVVSGDAWDFSDAPLVAQPSYRLLIDDSHTTVSTETVAQVALNVECSLTRPAAVSQAFTMVSRADRHVEPHAATRARITGSCNFEKDVIVSRLYRRTRFITTFSVNRLTSGEPLWLSRDDSVLDLEPPQEFQRNDGLEWTCEYQNSGDVSFDIDGTSSDACGLFGIYRLPDGTADSSPEHCGRQ